MKIDLPLIPYPNYVNLFGGENDLKNAEIHFQNIENFYSKDGYEIKIKDRKISVKFSDNQGKFYAEKTFIIPQIDGW